MDPGTCGPLQANTGGSRRGHQPCGSTVDPLEDRNVQQVSGFLGLVWFIYLLAYTVNA